MAIEEPIAVEEEWAKVSVPDRKEVSSLNDFASHLSVEVGELMALQPKCWLLKEVYEKAFSSYKMRVDTAIGNNRRALIILDDFSHVKARLADIKNDIEFLRDWRTQNKEFMDEYQQNRVIDIIECLKTLKRGFEQLANEKIEGLEELRNKFERNKSILEPLGQCTHKWQPIEKSTVPIRSGWIPPEGSSFPPRKPEMLEFVSKRKCERCLKEEKVDLGSSLLL